MQTTYKLNTNEIDNSFFDSIKMLFPNREIKITIESFNETGTENQFEAWKKVEALQCKYPPKVISKEIDLSELANEVNL